MKILKKIIAIWIFSRFPIGKPLNFHFLIFYENEKVSKRCKFGLTWTFFLILSINCIYSLDWILWPLRFSVINVLLFVHFYVLTRTKTDLFIFSSFTILFYNFSFLFFFFLILKTSKTCFVHIGVQNPVLSKLVAHLVWPLILINKRVIGKAKSPIVTDWTVSLGSHFWATALHQTKNTIVQIGLSSLRITIFSFKTK